VTVNTFPRDPADFLPLPVAVLSVLLALQDSARHGHSIKVDLALRTGGTVVLGPGTLYPALKRMVKDGLIEETTSVDVRELDERRRYYKSTALGQEVARAEARRMVRLLSIGKRKGLIGPDELAGLD
jgi:DNA-binding PadR family transcriptional regulator